MRTSNNVRGLNAGRFRGQVEGRWYWWSGKVRRLVLRQDAGHMTRWEQEHVALGGLLADIRQASREAVADHYHVTSIGGPGCSYSDQKRSLRRLASLVEQAQASAATAQREASRQYASETRHQ